MNRLLFNFFTLAIIATIIPSTSGFALFSPLLLRINPAGIADRLNRSSSNVITDSSPIITANIVSENTSFGRPPLASVDFGHDEDLLRYKHELLSAVYEKSLTRGFE